MGTFERIRRISPYALIAFAVIFVAFMVASDADIANILRQGQDIRTAALAKVNGEKILYKTFEERVREQVEQQRSQDPENASNVDENQIRRNLWSQMLDEIILSQQAKELGIRVTDDEILDIMLENPPEYLRKPFTDSAGNFQRETYLEIMTNPDIIYNRLPASVSAEEKQRIVSQFKSDILKIEKYLREERLQTSMRTFVAIASSFVSPTYAKEKYINDNATASVRAIYFDIKSIPDNQVEVTEDEMKQYYEKNKKFYPEKPRRKLKYVIFPLKPSSQDSNAVNKKITKFSAELQALTDFEERSKLFEKKFQEYGGEVSDFQLAKDLPSQLAPYIIPLEVKQVIGPIQTADGTYFIRLEEKRKGVNEVAKASHVLIGFGNKKDSALAFAKSILSRAKRGEDFAELARKYSEDKASGVNGGDLGYFGKGTMVKPFEDAVFSANPGEIVGPIETQFGYHIIKVFERKSDEYKYSFIRFKPEMTRATLRAINRDAKLFKDKVAEGVPFDSVAKEFGLVARETDFFEQTRPVLGSNYLTGLAFKAKVGDVLEPLELKNQGIVVAQVVDQRKEGFMTFEDLKKRIEFILKNKKKLDLLESKAKEVYERVKNLGTLENIPNFDSTLPFQDWVDVRNNGYVVGIGQDFVFTSKIFTLPLGKLNPPFRGERAWYIVEVYKRYIPAESESEGQKKKYLENLITNYRQSSYLMWFNKVKENADIEDNRTEFYRDY